MLLLSTFSSLRRLILLAVFLFLACLVLLRNSQYSNYLPKYDLPKFSQDSTSINSDGNNKLTQPDKVEAVDVGTTSAPQPASASTSLSSTPVSTSSPQHLDTEESIINPDDIITPINHTSYQEIQEKIQKFIDWTPLNTPNHWPGWGDYKNADYDPNRWEGLDWENGYYENNGIKKLEKQGLTAEPYHPYPEYNTDEWKREWAGDFVACEGARGNNLNESDGDNSHVMRAFPSLPSNFPNVSVGSAEIMGLDSHSCIDRDGRYSPYGANKSDAFDWSVVYWGQLQDQCLNRNKARYSENARGPMNLKPSRPLPEGHDQWPPASPSSATSTLSSSSTSSSSTALSRRSGTQPHSHPQSHSSSLAPKYHPRTAVLIRTWEGYHYADNDIHAIRAMVTELSLLSGGEYQLYLLVNVKEREADIYDNPQVYEDVLKRVVPRELRDISVLWTERVCEQWYPDVGDWQVYWQQFMPLQWFSKNHPEFDYIWNWETDARYTGNHYHFLERLAHFSKMFPRKHLWERNARFYFPESHGNFASYLADTDAAIDNATAAGEMTPVWGPLPALSVQTPIGPTPPTTQEDDDFEWGVGEEADLITLQPIWDPSHTEWSYRDRIWNFEAGIRPIFTPNDPSADLFNYPGYYHIPRRVFINTVARFSKRMLHAMHIENLAGRSTQAEMWPATVALHHGLKAVYAPHPIWADRKWPAWYQDAIFNADGGKTARWGQQRDSPYNHDREANFRGWSWYFATGFPKVLYRRYLGWMGDDGGLGKLGGRKYENKGVMMGDGNIVGGHGKMCLPPMLLHPVKNVVENQQS